MKSTTAADWIVAVGGQTSSAIYEPAATRQRAVFVCAHGAGGNKNDSGIAKVAIALRTVGLGTVRYNFPYRERGSSRPDAMPLLMECVAAVATRARAETGGVPLIIGGRSMGGRAASMLAAESFEAAGLLLLAYPLHPPGKLDQLRDAHLPGIHMPVLCVNGTRDAFCQRDLMERTLRNVRARWTMHWVQDADHGFRVPRASGRRDGDVYAELQEVASTWLTELGL